MQQSGGREAPLPIDECFKSAKIVELRGHTKRVICMDWNREGRKLATGGSDKNVLIWDVAHGKGSMELECKGHTDVVERLGWNPTSSDVLASTSADSTLRFWDARSGKCTGTVPVGEEAMALAWTRDGLTVIVANRDDLATVVDARTMTATRTVKLCPEVNDLLAVAGPGGAQSLLVAGGTGLAAGQVEVLSLPGMQPLHTLRAHTAWCGCLAADKTRGRVAIASADGLLSVWDLAELCCVGTVASLDAPCKAVGFSCDGRYLSAAVVGGVEIFSASTFAHAYRVKCPGEASLCAWSPTFVMMAYATGPADDDKGRPEGGLGGANAPGLWLLSQIGPPVTTQQTARPLF